MSTSLELTLLELIRRLNGTALEPSRVTRGGRRPADSTSNEVEVSKKEANTQGGPNCPRGETSRASQEESFHDLRSRTKDRKGAVIE
uniref:X protein n=1 Tax=Parrot bornavirus 2 TaxID=1548715 RepID=F6JSI7_9MONO|nr:X protein [Parrot bornavirus 2]AIC82494.1 X protein [Parrot bornavirus 2]AOF44350.1 X protein [Parrot bornavirus 2]AOF44354.1 X protein [Parrot bornavirus 2]QGM12616.1 X protein [Parrot bornavirus 2]